MEPSLDRARTKLAADLSERDIIDIDGAMFVVISNNSDMLLDGRRIVFIQVLSHYTGGSPFNQDNSTYISLKENHVIRVVGHIQPDGSMV